MNLVNKIFQSQFSEDLLYFPTWGRGIGCVWRRNFLYFRYTFWTAVSWIFLEPLLYLFALGYGLGTYIESVQGMRYAEFIAPAMLATTGMFVAFFEGTYGTYTKLSRQNTFQTTILTPVGSDEIAIGEIAWCASKGFLSVLGVGLVVTALGLMTVQALLPSLLVLALMCWVFAALGVWLAAVARSYETFTYLTSGFITPMSLFCGTYFPLDQMPRALQAVAQLLPLTHGLASVRIFVKGELEPNLFLSIGYLIFLAIIATNLAAARLERKLIS
jgi:lipooligosaccharide transport system permease protein